MLLKRSVRSSKYDPFADEVEIIQANPDYAFVRFADGVESTVSLRRLAPLGDMKLDNDSVVTEEANVIPEPEMMNDSSASLEKDHITLQPQRHITQQPEHQIPRRSERIRKPPQFYHNEINN